MNYAEIDGENGNLYAVRAKRAASHRSIVARTYILDLAVCCCWITHAFPIHANTKYMRFALQQNEFWLFVIVYTKH